jgi:hypothetical protein
VTATNLQLLEYRATHLPLPLLFFVLDSDDVTRELAEILSPLEGNTLFAPVETAIAKTSD